jgi:hypothetical protein
MGISRAVRRSVASSFCAAALVAGIGLNAPAASAETDFDCTPIFELAEYHRWTAWFFDVGGAWERAGRERAYAAAYHEAAMEGFGCTGLP